MTTKHFTDYLSHLKGLADFRGRTSRKRYWKYVVTNLISAYLFFTVDSVFTFVVFDTPTYSTNFLTFLLIYELIWCIPNFAIATRRLHDSNVSGWFLLIPVISTFLLLRKGDEGPNDYGPPPVK